MALRTPIHDNRSMKRLSLVLLLATACSGSGDGVETIPPDASIGTPTTAATIAGCRIFPDDNPWNLDVSANLLHPRRTQLMSHMNPSGTLHPDWGNWTADQYGIPWDTGTGATPAPINWTASWGDDESDPLECTIGPTTYPFCYPIPTTVRIEGGSSAPSNRDRHVLYIDTAGAPNDCTLYELYNTQNVTGTEFDAANGAVFPLGTNTLRPEGWTSADAAGLPILPGLVRYDEIEAGEIRHAIRFTMDTTARSYIHPATHQAGTSGSDLPPMGLRLRLRADYPEAGLSPEALIIVTALKRYGMILADNGSDWYLTGDSDDRWDDVMDGILDALGDIHGRVFEIVYSGPIIGG
jgi:hypothetical protein